MEPQNCRQVALSLDASSRRLLFSQPLTPVYSQPIVVNGMVFLGDEFGNVYTFGL